MEQAIAVPPLTYDDVGHSEAAGAFDGIFDGEGDADADTDGTNATVMDKETKLEKLK